jgi:hypothetical protein
MSKQPPPIGLSVGRYRLRYARQAESRFPAFAGSAWRGAFGHALKRTVCVTRLRQCPDCLLYRSCVYPYIFETPPPLHAEKMRRYTAAPHPFVIETPLTDKPAEDPETTAVGVTLFGNANRYVPYVIYAFQRAGEEGVGRDRLPLSLVRVQQSAGLGEDWETIHEPDQPLDALPPVVPEIPPLPTDVEIRLLTPLRIRRQESLVNERDFSFADFFNVLLRRISLLTYFHTDTPLETDFKFLVEQSRRIALISSQLRWYDWTRYSSRQKTTMEMGGLIGEFKLPAQGMEPFWPYLWLGQWTHAGKGASMGLGQYAIYPENLL